MKKFTLYLIVAIATFLVANYFIGCSSVNKTHDIHNETVDSSDIKKVDSSSTVSHDSSSVKKELKKDSNVDKHIQEHQIKLTFDTSAKAFNQSNPYKYNLGGKTFSTPEPIASATIDDTNETDSSNVTSDASSDSTLVKVLNATKVNKLDSSNLKKKVADDDSHKIKTGTGLPWWLYAIGIGLIIIAGAIGYFKYLK